MRIIICLFCVLSGLQVDAQIKYKELEGKVLGENKALIGATVYLLNDQDSLLSGTTTDKNGYFKIDNISGSTRLVSSYLGYEEATVIIDFKKYYYIELKESRQSEDTIVIKDYPFHYFNTSQLSKISLRGNHPGMPASFEDATRALLRTPGISNVSDQNNGVSYHGLAPHFNKWEMDGAEIINPNHLSNAGTRSDVGSSSSGGVLSIPFDFLERYEFFGAPFDSEKGNAIGGISNIVPVRTISNRRSFLKAGLNGMEVGYYNSKKDKRYGMDLSDVAIHYRYSFVGLLADLGVDFGGESIRYQDLNIRKTIFDTGKQSMFYTASWGQSKNDQIGDPMDVLRNESHYKNTLFYTGFTYRNQLTDIGKTQHSIFYSRKKESQNIVGLTGVFDLFEYKFSYHGYFDYTLNEKNAFRYGLDMVVDNQDFYQERANLSAPIDLQTVNVRVRPFMKYLYDSDYFMFNSTLALANYSLTKETFLEPSILIANKGSKVQVALKASRSSQSKEAIDFGTNILESVKRSNNAGLSILLKDVFVRQFKFKTGLFYHNVETIQDQFYNIAGIESSLSLPLFRNHHLNMNGTFFDYLEQDDWFTIDKEGNPNKYNVNYIFNFMHTYQSQFTKKSRLHASYAFHYRGGTNEALGLNEYKRVADYARVDIRLRFDFGKNQRNSLSLDIQNLLDVKNEGYYYQNLDGEFVLQQQQGLIPLFSYTRYFN